MLALPVINYLILPATSAINLTFRVVVGILLNMLCMLAAGIIEVRVTDSNSKLNLLLDILPAVLLSYGEMIVFVSFES